MKSNEPSKEDPIQEQKEDLTVVKKPKRWLSGCLIFGTIAFLSCFFLFGFFPRLTQTKKINDIAAQDPLPAVTIMIAQPTNKPIELILPSSTHANHVTPIWARANGYLVQLLVDIGDVVQEGQLLAVLDTPDLDQQYNQAIADLENAKAKRDIAKISAERWQALYALDFRAISKEEVDERTATYTASIAEVNSFEANLKRFQDLVDFKYIRAPFDGIITQRNIDLGALISAGSNGSPQQLFVIATSSIIRLFVEVPQHFFRSIHVGVEGITAIREFPNKNFVGRVVRYAKALDPIARTLRTELHIDNPDGTLFPGLYAEVHFFLKPEQPYFTIPIASMIVRAGVPQVALLDDQNIVHLKSIKVGIDNGDSIEVVDGILANDKIVTNPTEKIRDGVQVRNIS